MKKIFSLLMLLLSAGTASAAFLDTTDAVRASLETRYRLMDNGLLHGDVHRYLSVAVDDLVTVDDDNIFPTREQFEEHLSKDIGSFQHISAFDSHIDKLEVIGDFAKVEVTSSFDGTMPDRKDPAVIHRYVMQLKFTHEWRKIGNEWKLTRLVELGETGAIDGKPIPAEHK